MYDQGYAWTDEYAWGRTVMYYYTYMYYIIYFICGGGKYARIT